MLEKISVSIQTAQAEARLKPRVQGRRGASQI